GVVGVENADGRLARSDRPQFLPLRRVLARDIERLKNAPSVDVTGMTVRIDQLIGSVDQLPLLVEARAKPAEPEPAEPTEGSWDRAWRAVWEELKGLVRGERLGRFRPAPIPPAGPRV